MDTSKLKKFAQAARKDLLEQVSSKLAFVLKPESSARREYPAVVNELEKAVSAQGEAGLIDQVAYTWFNRFCALRFMDVNGYNRVGVVSPAEGQVQPEILAEAKSGVIDDTQINTRTADQIRGLLNGSISSPDAQTEAYRLLIVGSCNALFDRMPYMFERIQDFTELLMPDDLLSENSILANMRKVMTLESCQDVEIIGWLYQFYISEKKDQVFAGLKKNQKITAENIPAATQLFTPHWIVRYLVENSLGRLWMLNRPNSRLTEQMEYYIAPEEPETDFLKINSPEEIRICDPAAGSGHMLTYAFDLLYVIYEEEGYDANDIPGLILKHNLYGIEIDDRAGALAAFALEMKAAAKLGRRRFLKMDVKPDICVLENVSFTDSEMDDVMAIVGKDLYSADLRETLTQFEQAKNFGSLIVPKLKDPAEMLRLIDAKDFAGDMLLKEVHERLVKVLRMAEALSPKYHVVVANPPYMGSGSMNADLSKFVQQNYPDSKSDIMACFIELVWSRCLKGGYFSMINQQSWLFLDYFKRIRASVLQKSQICNLLLLGSRTFPEISGEVVQSTAFCLKNTGPRFDGVFYKLNSFDTSGKKEIAFLEGKGRFTVDQERHFLIPDAPLGFWFSEKYFEFFKDLQALSALADVRAGLQTGDNEKFIRQWTEVSSIKLNEHSGALKSADENVKWYPYNKGGSYRKWHGNRELVVDWENDGRNIRADKLRRLDEGLILASNSKPKNTQYYFRQGLTWSTTGGRFASFRLMPDGELFDIKGSSAFPHKKEDALCLLGQLNSYVTRAVIEVLTPSLDFNPGYIAKLPTPETAKHGAETVSAVSRLVLIARADWNAYETSWDFTSLPLISSDHRAVTLQATYAALRTHWQGMTDEMQRLEEENNRIFIDAYGLRDELTPEVPLEEITLTCNPAYRYGVKGSEGDREIRLRADTMAEFLSYAVGCMFGRYSLDEPGLILANQGETLEEFLEKVPDPSFMPDDDNVIPMIDFEGDWFEDDITERFKHFLRVTFGEKHYGENLAFIESALGKNLQKYFTKDFYSDHVQRYKKRPIYWLFSSPKGTFNALIYMHRYTPSTVSVVLNEYLREFRTKLEARKDSYEQISISASSSQKEKTQALKMIDKLDKAIDEVNGYEREVLYPLAGQNIQIDLDDGVKHNYPLFGSALKKITGLS